MSPGTLVSIVPDGRGGCYGLDDTGRLFHGRWILMGGTDNAWNWIELVTPRAQWAGTKQP